jgi:uncharacterized membrane protein
MSEKVIRKIFDVGVILKGIVGFFQVLGGMIFLFTGSLTSLVQFMVREELIEDPKDFVANLVQHSLPYLSLHTQFFVAIYLLIHGGLKIFLVISLLRDKLWAYPTSIIVFSLFIVYQLTRFAFTHSVFLIFLTVIDLAIIWLTWHEYKIVKRMKYAQV